MIVSNWDFWYGLITEMLFFSFFVKFNSKAKQDDMVHDPFDTAVINSIRYQQNETLNFVCWVCLLDIYKWNYFKNVSFLKFLDFILEKQKTPRLLWIIISILKKKQKAKKPKQIKTTPRETLFFPALPSAILTLKLKKKKKRKKKRKKELVSIQCSGVLLRADAAVSGGTGNLCCLWWCSSTRLDERAKPRILKQPRLFEPPRGRRRNDAASTYQNRRSVLFLFYECRHALQINVYLMHFCSCSFVSVALFYFPLDIEQQIYKSCVGAKAEWNITRRRTMATQYLMSTRQARLTTGRQQL